MGMITNDGFGAQSNHYSYDIDSNPLKRKLFHDYISDITLPLEKRYKVEIEADAMCPNGFIDKIAPPDPYKGPSTQAKTNNLAIGCFANHYERMSAIQYSSISDYVINTSDPMSLDNESEVIYDNSDEDGIALNLLNGLCPQKQAQCNITLGFDIEMADHMSEL